MQVQPYLLALEMMVQKTKSRSAPTQLSIVGPFKVWLKRQDLEVSDQQAEAGTYRLRMMYSNLLHHHHMKRSIPRAFKPKFTRIWNLMDYNIAAEALYWANESDESDDESGETEDDALVALPNVLMISDSDDGAALPNVLEDDDPEIAALLAMDDGEAVTPARRLRVKTPHKVAHRYRSPYVYCLLSLYVLDIIVYHYLYSSACKGRQTASRA